MKAADLGLLEEALAARGGLRRVGRRGRIHQRQPLDPVRGAPHHLERDVATHREAAQAEALGRRGQHRFGHRAHRFVGMDLDHPHVGDVGEVGDLALEQAGGVEQSRQQDEGRLGHGWQLPQKPLT